MSGMALDETLSVKVSGPERSAYEMAASAAGVSRHAWMRAILNAGAEITALPAQMVAAKKRARRLGAG